MLLNGDVNVYLVAGDGILQNEKISDIMQTYRNLNKDLNSISQIVRTI